MAVPISYAEINGEEFLGKADVVNWLRSVALYLYGLETEQGKIGAKTLDHAAKSLENLGPNP